MAERAGRIPDTSVDPVAETVRRTGLFDSLDPAAFDVLVRDLERAEAEPGELVIREGDPGDAVYVVFEGTVQIFTTAEDGSPLVLDKVGPGGYFGEQALLPGRSGRRNASVRAHSHCVLLKVPKGAFQRALADNHPLKERLLQVGEQQLRARLVRQSRLFRSLELGGVDAETAERTFEEGAVLFREGDPADCLYVILSGGAAVYREEEGRQVLLTRLREGQCVGELALLTRGVRAATVVAEGRLRVFTVGAERFLDLYARSPEVREYMQTLQRVYKLPRRGFVTQHAGRFLDRDCITTLYHLLDGRTLAASRVVGQEIFNLELVAGEAGPPPGATARRWADPAQGLEREVRVTTDGRLLGLTAHGPWPELPELCLLVMDDRPIAGEQLVAFEGSGSCGFEARVLVGRDAEVVCTCVQVDRGALRRAIAGGCRRVEELQERTSCGTVCGGCVPAVLEMLGRADWTAVTIETERTVAPGIRSLRLKPSDGPAARARPGQHIVVEAQIGGRWVRRPYTLSSPRGETEGYEITVKREPHGTFSRWLFDHRQPESAVRVSRPQGDYFWEPDGAPVVCLVAGIGVTPALAICRTIAGEGLPHTLHIDYSARSAADFACAEELRAAAAGHPNIHLSLRETARDGRLQPRDVEALVRRYSDAWFFLCGPPGYLEAVAGYLAASGVPRERIRIEVFTHAGDPPVAPRRRPAGAPAADAVAPERHAHLFIPPTPPARRPLVETTGRLAGALADLANAGLLDWSPLRMALDRMMARIGPFDPSIPRDRFGMLAELGKGPVRHQLDSFARLAARFGPNKRRALEARREGAPLRSTTPDGDTWVYAIPNAPLARFEGPHAVRTGWERAADGPVVTICVTRSPEAIRKMLCDDPAFDRGPLPYHYFQQALGSSSIVPDACRKAAGLFSGQVRGNETWESQRALGVNLFGPPQLGERAREIAPALADIADGIGAWVDAHPGRVVDANVLMSRIAYHMVIPATFGRVDTREFSELGQRLSESMRRVFHYVEEMMFGKRSVIPAFHADRAESARVIGRMIEIIREKAADGSLDEGQRASPLVRLIVHGDEHGPPDEGALFTFVLSVVFGGHETTGHMLSWAIYELGRNPELRAAVVDELDAFHDAHGSQPITPDQYDERPYTQALLYELGRRHPPIIAVPRTALAPGEVPPDPETGIGAFRYPKDAMFLCSIVGAHMDAAIYPEPRAFRIERFLEGITPEMSLAERGRQVWATARRREEEFRLLTFGAGPGSCLGRGFNMLEFFMVLDELLSRFAFELEDPDREVADTQTPVSGPEPGRLGVRIRRRAPGARPT